MRKKPTTCTISLWNITGSVSISTHADEAHKSVALVDFTVKLGDEETVRDLISGIARILELNEPQHDFLRHIILKDREGLDTQARAHLAKEVLA